MIINNHVDAALAAMFMLLVVLAMVLFWYPRGRAARGARIKRPRTKSPTSRSPASPCRERVRDGRAGPPARDLAERGADRAPLLRRARLRHIRPPPAPHHPDRAVPTYAAFFRERQIARYGGMGGRCC